MILGKLLVFQRTQNVFLYFSLIVNLFALSSKKTSYIGFICVRMCVAIVVFMLIFYVAVKI